MRYSTSVIAGLSATLIASSAAPQMSIPTDPAQTCTSDISDWFAGGKPQPNGPVNPPSSVRFTSDNPNQGAGPNICNFYQWGAQMFLWLTSPEGDGLVLDGPSVFTVTPENASGKRRLIANTTGAAYKLALREGKADDIGETGQAGSDGVLISQQKALVYYGIHANDVYGYFLSGQMTGGIKGAVDFPRNGADLKQVVAYAEQAYGAKIAHPEALALELKTSWVDATSVPDPASYITIEAEVPAYKKSADNLTWTQSGRETLRLALTGIHIVGTVQDHPEFVWATFEHVSNAPDATYYYTNDKGVLSAHPFSSDGSYVFTTKGGSESGANLQCAKSCGADIVAGKSCPKDGAAPVASCKGGVVPSSTVRMKPWGSAATKDASVVENNTRLLSINNSVRGQLSTGDLRKNYVQVGGIWTTTPPSGGDAPIPNQTGDQTAQMRGSLSLYNATMETYTFEPAPHCFSCHQLSQGAKTSFGAFQLSHIYSTIEPLPKQ